MLVFGLGHEARELGISQLKGPAYLIKFGSVPWVSGRDCFLASLDL